MTYLELFSRCLIVVVFAASAVSKTARFAEFTSSLRDLRVLPGGLVRASATTVVTAEYAVVLLALVWPVGGLLLATALLAAFSATIVVVLRRGSAAVCRCFGATGAAFGRQHVVRNVVLAAVAVTGVVASGGDGVTLRAAAVAVPAALVCAVAVIRLDDLVALFAPVPAPRR